jgi:glycerate 2-kinase
VSERGLLAELHRAALEEVHAGRALARWLVAGDPGPGPFVVLASGKAACAMAEAARDVLGARIAGGEVTTKDGHARALPGLVVREASHPVPDARSLEAGRAALTRAATLRDGEELLVLISGGASALWCAPAPGLTLDDKRGAHAALLAAGLPIGALNAVRKHLSELKGGGLVRAARGRRVRVYAVSDVPGDALADVGSAPASPDPTRFADALDALRAHGCEASLPAKVRAHLARGADGALEETLKPEDPLARACSGRVVASLDHALARARREAEARGLRVRALGRALDGDVELVAARLVREALRARQAGVDLVIAGGEPSVRVRGEGRGGRAQELALRLALALEGERGWTALCAGTDGTDGPTAAAGAFADANTLARARTRGLDPRAALEQSDVNPLLAALGDLFTTGPTETNVADVALVRLQPG